MPETIRSGTEKRRRYEDTAGVLMAISVIARKLARTLLAISQEAGKGGMADGKEEADS
jgi:hypothetical protein